MTATKESVLFLCTGNSARSQMAEALLRRLANDRFDVYSAGLEPRPIRPPVYEVMAELGLDLVEQRSKNVREYLGKKSFTYLITVCGRAEQNCPSIFPGVSQRLRWDFEDPVAAEGTRDELVKFREVRDQIDRRLRAWLTELGLPVAT